MRELLETKKTLVIVIAVGLITIAALLVYGILVTPARQPYRDALTQYTHVNTALSRTNAAINASTASDEEFTKSIAALEAAFESLKTENKALAAEPVLTEGEGKPLYEAYDKDLQAYITYNTNVIESMRKVRPVFRACSADMNNVTADAGGAKVMRDCATSMQKVTNVPDGDYKKLAQDFQAAYARLAILFERMMSLVDTNSAAYKALSEQRTEAVEQFSEASAAFSKSVQQHRKEILSTNSANTLKTYLEDSSRIF